MNISVSLYDLSTYAARLSTNSSVSAGTVDIATRYTPNNASGKVVGS